MGNDHDTHAVAISIIRILSMLLGKILLAETTTVVIVCLLTAQLQGQTFVHVLFKKLAKKLGELTSIRQILYRPSFLPYGTLPFTEITSSITDYHKTGNSGVIKLWQILTLAILMKHYDKMLGIEKAPVIIILKLIKSRWCGKLECVCNHVCENIRVM